MSKILICGIDGYLGWPLAQHFQANGWEVPGLDNYVRRERVVRTGGCSAIPITTPTERSTTVLKGHDWWLADLTSYDHVADVLRNGNPDVIVHLAEQPSAAWSMKSLANCVDTQQQNVVGTLNLLWAMREHCPDAHLIKLGTLGEYGTPGIPIPEGYFPATSELQMLRKLETTGQQHRQLYGLHGHSFPRRAGSWYHLSKVHDTFNCEFACRVWGLTCTDIMQGVVYGTRTEQIEGRDGDPNRWTRFDFDECFGTVINRFCAQVVVGRPLTVYGKGGQKRGFLPLRDVMQCIHLIANNPPAKGTHRVVNQFDQVYSINELAETVVEVAREQGLLRVISHLDNPRKEDEDHTYEVCTDTLRGLGYAPTADLRGEIRAALEDLLPHAQRIEEHKECLTPRIKW